MTHSRSAAFSPPSPPPRLRPAAKWLGSLPRLPRIRWRRAGSYMEGFEEAIMNMTQGVCLYDRDDRLQLANEQFCRIYSQDIALLRRGMPLREVIAASTAVGNYPGRSPDEVWRERKEFIDRRQPGTFLQVLGDGRQIAILHQPLGNGGWVATYEDVTERRQAEAQIRFMAHHDALTALPNRILFTQTLNERLHGCTTEPCALLAIDLDGFKPVNDRLGHAAGDLLLQAVAGRLAEEVRDRDMAARLGGDEFAVLLADVTAAEALTIAQRINAALCRDYHLGSFGLAQIGASMGVACAPLHASMPTALMSLADKALYAVKTSGIGIPCLYATAMDEVSPVPAADRRAAPSADLPGLQTLRAAATVTNDLSRALKAGQVHLNYQPIFSANVPGPVAYEVTSRWVDPRHGEVPAGHFIAAAEESGFIVAFMEWVLRSACIEAASWSSQCKISVNFSPVNFSQPRLLEAVEAILRETGLPAERLIIELTEGLMLMGTRDVVEAIAGFRARGIEIWLDDFGTGYSNFSYLQSIPFSAIKIDRSLLAERPKRTAVLRGIITMGHACGLRVVAEGVETEEQRALLTALGCDGLQGFLLGRPQSTPAFGRSPAQADMPDAAA